VILSTIDENGKGCAGDHGLPCAQGESALAHRQHVRRVLGTGLGLSRVSSRGGGETDTSRPACLGAARPEARSLETSFCLARLAHSRGKIAPDPRTRR